MSSSAQAPINRHVQGKVGMAPGGKKVVMAASKRNKQPILDVLKTLIPADAKWQILEMASGSGQHVSHFAPEFPHCTFFPTDIEPSYRASIDAYCRELGLDNVRPALEVNAAVSVDHWPEEAPRSVDAILCSNMIHITPYACTEGLMSSAGKVLRPGGMLIIYGPFRINGALEPQSNVDFDKSLRARNPEWGVRDVQDLQRLGEPGNLSLKQIIDMPANNKIVCFVKGD